MTQKQVNKAFAAPGGEAFEQLYSTPDDQLYPDYQAAMDHSRPLFGNSSKIGIWYPEDEYSPDPDHEKKQKTEVFY